MRRGLLGLMATVTAVAAGSGAVAPATAAEGGRALPRTVSGHLDAVVTTASGRTVGHLSAGVLRSGRGAGQFRHHSGGAGASELVHFRARRAGAGARIVVDRHRALRLDLRIVRGGRVHGAGRVGGTRVRVRGVAGEKLEHVRRGHDMLVIGRPSGPAYAALRKLLRPVRFRQADHGGHELLRDREDLHDFGALVLGAGVKADDARVQAVLHRFFGTGKWVVAAPGSAALRTSLSDLHGTPFEGDTRRGIAVRTTGAEGTTSNVRPLVRFPAAPGGRLTATQSRAVAASQARWFRSQLLAHGRAHDGIPQDRRRRARAAAVSSVSFTPPFNASVIEVRVPYQQHFTMSDSQVHRKLPVCGQSVDGQPDQFVTQCPGTGWPASISNPRYPTADACETFLRQGKRVLPWASLQWASQHPSGTLVEGQEPEYRVNGNIGQRGLQMAGFPAGFEGWHGNTCPEAGSQVGVLEGADYFYGIADTTGAHTVVVLTEPTVTAAVPDVPPGKLFKSGEANGVMRACAFSCGDHPLRETAWYLGSYDHRISLSGEHLDSSSLQYDNSMSFPRQRATFDEAGVGLSGSTSFSFGVFGAAGTGTIVGRRTATAEVAVDVPSWRMELDIGTRDVARRFVTNAPVPWETIQAHLAPAQAATWTSLNAPLPGPANAPFTLNGPNVRDFAPAALAVWTGARTFGPVSMTSTHTLGMVDHFTRLDLQPPHGYFPDAFAVEQQQFSLSPDASRPTANGNDPRTFGTGLNFCDPHVRDPDFLDACRRLYPTANL